jgi:aspartyl-tRNA(Asn)/glutamyl-tRNA(Gln) amidotransferase subunit C
MDLGEATSNGMDLKTIKHIASLARISITEKEESSIKDKLSSILGYIDKLNEVNTDKIEQTYQTVGPVNSMRGDKHIEDFKVDEKLSSRLVGQAPENQDNFVKVKSILNK